MFKYISALGLAASLTTCAHLERRPAAADALPLTCEKIFQYTFSPESLQHIFDLSHQVYGVVRAYLGRQYPQVVHDFMRQAAQAGNDCETERDVDLYAADINSKIDLLDIRLKSAADQNTTQAVLSKPIFSSDEIARQLACYGECKVRVAHSTAESIQSCEAKCAIDPDLAKFYDESLAMRRLMDTCFAGVNSENSTLKQNEFIRIYNEKMPPFLAKLRSLQVDTRRDLEVDRESRENLIQLRAEYSKFKTSRPPRRCGKANYSWTKSVQAASVNLLVDETPTRFGMEGTGFYFSTGEGRFLATAAHVPDLDVRDDASRFLSQVLANGKTRSKAFEFSIAAGLFDSGRDVSLKRAPERGPSLPLAGEDETPELGQRFYVTGFPASGRDKFQIVRCTFLGFSPRLPDVQNGVLNAQKDAAYKLRCPGAGDLHGASGGALVDARGRVWGINVSSEPATSSFHAMPISLSASGRLNIGIQKVFLSDLCYNALEFEPHRCQVMPNMYEREVPQ